MFFLGMNSLLELKKTMDGQVEGKKKEVELKKYEIGHRGMSRPTAIFVTSGH